MDAVAYTDAAVIEFVNKNFIPIRIPASDSELAPRFLIKWTPTLLILDKEGIAHDKNVGFFWPQELISCLLLGMGKTYFDKPDRTKAIACFEQIPTSYPRSSQAPEAIYLSGVAQYIEGHDVANLIEIYDRLKSGYPDSQWLMRADPYRLLKKK
ncbi:Tetratricopeptide repeat-containing protein [Syntrophus gentianae]|uniref:Tetratricopeptide repeat-containing protein n=1 Tax=Syntrophus gentianae TaxID=43775 RepID=A0A1H7YL51_9BACT|nr:tetratricopeptide repeat protein [Syntrophus gentianae]SEM46017.1 Tetratricopeptide repeat-containing protein [Syntrophus gentianae]